jgi:hypothetical protein
MTDKEFIYDYLENNYTVIIDGFGLLFKDKIFNESLNADNLKVNFNKIIGNWETDEGTTSFELAKEWHNDKKNSLVKDLNDYLNDCIFELGVRDWSVTKPDGTKINAKYLIEKFEEKYSKEFITHFYGEWYREKVCEASEKIMNQW